MLKSLEICGYRVFDSATKINFSQSGFTCIAGKNNSGKSSVLSVLNVLKYSANFPSRVDSSLPPPDLIDSASLHLDKIMKVTITFSFSDFKISNPQIFKFIDDYTSVRRDPSVPSFNEGHRLRMAISQNPVTMAYEFEEVRVQPGSHLRLKKILLNGFTLLDENMWAARFQLSWSQDSQVFSSSTSMTHNGITQNTINGDISYCFKLLAVFLNSLCEIGAIRSIPYSIARVPVTNLSPALSEATKLLAQWKESDRTRYGSVIRFLNQVDDSIGDLRFLMGANGEFDLKIAKDVDQDNPQITLKNSGTGISQLAGMATYLLHHQENIILIDEPQAFLHPRAEVALLHLMQKSKHQIIVASHSPVFINGARDGLVCLNKKNGFTSALNVVDSDGDTESFFALAQDLGVPANHLLAGYGILWVEGPTEISVISKLRSNDKEFDNLLVGVNIIPMPNTGDFAGPKVTRITRSISQVLANKVGINSALILDKEFRSQIEMDNLKSQFGDVLHFLPAHEIESFFLVPAAVHSLMNELAEDNKIDFPTSIHDVETFLESALHNPKHTPSRILDDCFQKFIMSKYEKVTYGPRLAQLCLLENINSFESIKSIIKTATAQIKGEHQ